MQSTLSFQSWKSSRDRIWQRLLVREFAHTAALSVSLQLHPGVGSGPQVCSVTQSCSFKRSGCICVSVYGKPCLFPHTKSFWTLTHQPSNDLVALLVEDENIDRGIV